MVSRGIILTFWFFQLGLAVAVATAPWWIPQLGPNLTAIGPIQPIIFVR
jgi:hypothetical protein